MKVSACICTRNEARNIRGVLENIKGQVDEIVVVDGASTDGTAEIAREYTDKVYAGSDRGFGDPDRAIYVEKASNNWLLPIDADERLSPKLLDDLDTLTELGDNGFLIPRRNYYTPDRYYRHIHYPDLQLRLYDRRSLVQVNDKVHSMPRIYGRLHTLAEPYHIVHLDPIYSNHARYKRYAGFQNKDLNPKYRLLYKPLAPIKFAGSLARSLRGGCYKDGVAGLKAAIDEALYYYWLFSA